MAEVPTMLEEIDKLDSKIDRLAKLEGKLAASIIDIEKQIAAKTQATTKADPARTRKQLQHELENAKSALKNYQVQLKHYVKLSQKTGKAGLQQLAALEQQNRQKDKLIAKLQEEVKELQTKRRRQEKAMAEREKQRGKEQNEMSRAARAAQQARTLQGLLTKAEQNLAKKKTLLQSRQNQLRQLQLKFEEECKRQGVDPEQVRRPLSKRRKQTSDQKLRSRHNERPQLSIREIMRGSKVDEQEMSEAAILRKKEILERNNQQMKRRYKQQLQSLERRLKEVKEERVLLEQRVQAKQEQKRNQARRKTSKAVAVASQQTAGD